MGVYFSAVGNFNLGHGGFLLLERVDGGSVAPVGMGIGSASRFGAYCSLGTWKVQGYVSYYTGWNSCDG